MNRGQTPQHMASLIPAGTPTAETPEPPLFVFAGDDQTAIDFASTWGLPLDRFQVLRDPKQFVGVHVPKVFLIPGYRKRRGFLQLDRACTISKARILLATELPPL